MRYVDALSEDGDGVTRYDWLEELEELHHQRLDLNAVSRDDLLRLHFLSEEVADSIIARREKLRGFYDIGDLMTVSGLNFMDLRLLYRSPRQHRCRSAPRRLPPPRILWEPLGGRKTYTCCPHRYSALSP